MSASAQITSIEWHGIPMAGTQSWEAIRKQHKHKVVMSSFICVVLKNNADANLWNLHFPSLFYIFNRLLPPIWEFNWKNKWLLPWLLWRSSSLRQSLNYRLAPPVTATSGDLLEACKLMRTCSAGKDAVSPVPSARCVLLSFIQPAGVPETAPLQMCRNALPTAPSLQS